MKYLGLRNYTLLEQGIKVCGNCGPEAVAYNVEQFYVDEYDTIVRFMAWVHETGLSFGSGNYEQRFREFRGADPVGAPGGCQAQQAFDAQVAKQGNALEWTNSLISELRELAEVCPSVTSTDCYRTALDLLQASVDASQLQRSGYSSKEFVGCFFEGTATTKCGHCYDCREHYR